MTTRLSNMASTYGTPITETSNDDTKFLRFGNDHQAFYGVPVSDTNMYAQLSGPGELTLKSHVTFDRILQQLSSKIWNVVSLLERSDPSLVEERHVQPDLRVFQPGEYLKSTTGPLSSQLQKERQRCYKVLFRYGSHQFEIEFESENVNSQTIQRAVNRLLEKVLHSLRVEGCEEVLGKKPELEVAEL